MSPANDKTSHQRLYIPDFKRMCPWTASMNPHYETAGKESAAWIDSFGVFQGAKRAAYRAAAAELLAARTYSYAGYEEYRTACDFLALLFVIDEVCDELDGPDASSTGDAILRAMRSEPGNDSTIVRIAKEWRDRFYQKDLPNAQKRFMQVFKDYLDGVIKESGLRAERHILTVAEHRPLRRKFSGTQAAFSLFQYIHGINLPEAVFQDEAFQTMYWAAVDMVNTSNDVYSYKMEHFQGLDGSNLITVLMHHEGLGLQEATDKISKQFQELVDTFIRGKSTLPSFAALPGGYDGIDEDVSKLVHSMEQWVIGNLTWSFETPRYFGAEGNYVSRTLVVSIQSPPAAF